MKKLLSLVAVFVMSAIPFSAWSQTCVPSASPLWMSPEKGATDVPIDAALLVSTPLGVTISLVIDEDIPPLAGGGYGQYIFPMNGALQNGNNSGYLEANLGGSTAKKTPFQFETSALVSTQTVERPSPTFVSAGPMVPAADATFCDEVIMGLFCENEPNQGFIQVGVSNAAQAWAVRANDTEDWVIIPGECNPTVHVPESDPVDRCVDLVAISESGNTSEVVMVCVGDTFDNEAEGLTGSDQEDKSASGCKSGSHPFSIPLLVLLGIAGWTRRRLIESSNV